MVMLMHIFLNHLYQLGNRLNQVLELREISMYLFFFFLCKDRKVALLGTVQALFEASMYVFVLEWTPALTEASNQAFIDKKDNTNPPIPHGLKRKRFF
jgi:hypothetical protein